MDEQQQPFFVIGADRSGTTLLRLYLNAHSRLAIPSESWFLIDLLDRFGATKELDEHHLREAAAIVADHPRFIDGWRVDVDALVDRLAPFVPLPTARFIDELFRAETGLGESAVWGDKTPEYVEHVHRLDACFPRSRFVNVVRDGRDVYLSLAKRRWSDRGYTPHELGRYWSRCLRAAARAGEHLGPRLHEIRYEDLVLETRATLIEVCEFLGVEFEERILDAHEEADTVITDSENAAGVHEKLSRRPRPSDVGRWREFRGSLPLRLAAGVMADELRSAGYADAPGPLAAGARRGVAAGDHLWRRRVRPKLRRVLRRLRPPPTTST